MKATASAHSNIALVKYWGKRDEASILPWTGSLSMTLDALAVATTVAFDDGDADRVEINGVDLKGAARQRVVDTLDLVRAEAGFARRARVLSRSDFPTGAGLASSAAGGAALAAAASWAAGLDPAPEALSILARRNSGSACRSIHGGFSEWVPGERPDGTDSFAVPLFDERHWPELRMIAAIGDTAEKAVSSREGMRRTVTTSPFYEAWRGVSARDLVECRGAIEARDLTRLGEIAERNAWRMHAAALGAEPPLRYFTATTLTILDGMQALRKQGREVYFTLDAGPNPILLCLASDVADVTAFLESLRIPRWVVSGPGRGVERSEAPLF